MSQTEWGKNGKNQGTQKTNRVIHAEIRRSLRNTASDDPELGGRCENAARVCGEAVGEGGE